MIDCYKKVLFFLFFFCSIMPFLKAQQPFSSSFVEYGASAFVGDHTPLWQASNQHGLSSVKNNTYIRGGFFYNKELKHSWSYRTGVDMALAAGFTSTTVVQQAFLDINYNMFGISIGSKELDSPLLNRQLSSGGLTWSGNARPIPQVRVGIPDYVRLSDYIRFKAEMSYGWFTDNNYQKKRVGAGKWYTKDIKYHHKSFFLRIQKPQSHWVFDFSVSLDTQFGGYKVGGIDEGDLGNSLKDYWNVLIPRGGNNSGPEGEKYYQGNYLGSEHFRVTYKTKEFSIACYLENFYDDFSGMGKLNGMDGLWGIEYNSGTPQLIDGIALEYYQTTNQSGPLHGVDNSVVKRTGGADDYYNNDWYPGWVHWGMAMANPLITSPIYSNDGDMTLKYNRVKAIHLGWQGTIIPSLTYRAKISYNQTWGTPFKPTIEILENYSIFVECNYRPQELPEWNFCASLAFDMGEIYGDNLGLLLKVRKNF